MAGGVTAASWVDDEGTKRGGRMGSTLISGSLTDSEAGGEGYRLNSRTPY